MRPQGIKMNFLLSKLKPSEIQAATDKVIEKHKAIYEAIGSVKTENVTFENCIKPLIDVHRTESLESAPLDFAQHCATEKNTREASVASSKKLSEFNVEMSMNKNVFNNLKAFKENVGFKGLSKEQIRFIERELIHGKRNGLHLDEKTREKVKKYKKRISDLATEFSSNINEDKTELEFTEEELAGVPKDVLSSFERTDSGKCKVTMKYPHFFPVTKKCHVPETRKKMQTAYQSRCIKENTPILEELIQLRQKCAELLGYKNHATYVHELRMAKKPDRVAKFLSDLAIKLQPLWEKEREEMLKLKKEECKKYGYDFNGELDIWDVRYYTNMIEETVYAVDKEKLKEYFPMETVTKGLLEIYQLLLGLNFTEIKDFESWHEDVQLFRVDDVKTNKTMGYFFLDLFPREGKYGHAAIFDLQNPCFTPDGDRQVAVCAMMANFPKPIKEKPSLLEHDDVETFFHEFGHIMHVICGEADLSYFYSFAVARDFVEAPSQMLENWVWYEESLAKMSGHYKDKSPIPKDLLEKLIASRTANAGCVNLRQIILATYDQRIHTRGEADTMKLFAQTYEEILGIKIIPNTNMPANWGHLCGYDAQYYGYLWSEVFSFDMFDTCFKQEGLLCPKVGKKYRDGILKPAATTDEDELLKEYLGREPSDEAFLKAKGLLKS